MCTRGEGGLAGGGGLDVCGAGWVWPQSQRCAVDATDYSTGRLQYRILPTGLYSRRYVGGYGGYGTVGTVGILLIAQLRRRKL